MHAFMVFKQISNLFCQKNAVYLFCHVTPRLQSTYTSFTIHVPTNKGLGIHFKKIANKISFSLKCCLTIYIAILAQ